MKKEKMFLIVIYGCVVIYFLTGIVAYIATVGGSMN